MKDTSLKGMQEISLRVFFSLSSSVIRSIECYFSKRLLFSWRHCALSQTREKLYLLEKNKIYNTKLCACFGHVLRLGGILFKVLLDNVSLFKYHSFVQTYIHIYIHTHVISFQLIFLRAIHPFHGNSANT